MCASHDRSELRVTPRNLSLSEAYMNDSPMLIRKSLDFLRFGLEPIKRKSVFFSLIFGELAANQDLSSNIVVSNLRFRLASPESSGDALSICTVSSAYWMRWPWVMKPGRSLMNKVKRHGPTIEPCGTPHVIGRVSFPPRTTCFRPDRYDRNHSTSTPYHSSFYHIGQSYHDRFHSIIHW